MTTASSTSDASPAGRREWIALAVLALPCMLVTMDLTVLFLAVPALTADLEPSSAQLLWITDVYGFLIAGALITMGTLGDRIGRRRVLAVDGHDAGPRLERPDGGGRHRVEHVGDRGVAGQLHFDAIRSGAFAQAGEETHCQPHERRL